MRHLSALGVVALGTALYLAAPLLADSRKDTLLERTFQPGGSVRLDLAAGAYWITGTSGSRIRVDWSMRDMDQSGTRVWADVDGRRANIRTDGTPRGVRAKIEVPRRTDLVVNLSAGEVTLRDVEGSKDLSAWAGRFDVEIGDRARYRRVDASVRVGELRASPFDVRTGGLLRSFHWAGKGAYDLRARLTAGEISLVH